MIVSLSRKRALQICNEHGPTRHDASTNSKHQMIKFTQANGQDGKQRVSQDKAKQHAGAQCPLQRTHSRWVHSCWNELQVSYQSKEAEGHHTHANEKEDLTTLVITIIKYISLTYIQSVLKWQMTYPWHFGQYHAPQSTCGQHRSHF